MSRDAGRRALAVLVVVLAAAAAVRPVATAAAAAPDRAGAPPSPAPPAGGPPDAGSPPADPRALTFRPLALTFPRPESLRLPNGVELFLLRDPELPIVDLSFYLRGGSIYDPPEKAGLADLATHMMRTGGTRDLTPDQVDERLETLAVDISIEAGDDALDGRLSCLKDAFPEALGILAGMLRQPRFDAARLEVEKARLLESIKRRWDEPDQIAGLTFRSLVYGAASPWARLDTAESVGRIGRDDLDDWARRTLRPTGALVAVSGDFEPAAMKRLLRDTLAGWSGGRAELPTVARIEDRMTPGVALVERPLTQSSILLGHLGATRFDPDKFPLFVLNYILGEGGFSSRLVKEVRSTRGLAYAVGGGIGTDSDRGLFAVTCKTRAGATVEAIRAIRDVVQRLRDDGPTEAEVREAKEARRNSLAFTLDNNAAFMENFLYYRYYGYPADYLETWNDKMAAVTRDDVMRAARRLLHPERLLILVVGRSADFEKPLAALGLGEARPVTPGGAAGAPAPASGR